MKQAPKTKNATYMKEFKTSEKITISDILHG